MQMCSEPRVPLKSAKPSPLKSATTPGEHGPMCPEMHSHRSPEVTPAISFDARAGDEVDTPCMPGRALGGGCRVHACTSCREEVPPHPDWIAVQHTGRSHQDMAGECVALDYSQRFIADGLRWKGSST